MLKAKRKMKNRHKAGRKDKLKKGGKKDACANKDYK